MNRKKKKKKIKTKRKKKRRENQERKSGISAAHTQNVKVLCRFQSVILGLVVFSVWFWYRVTSILSSKSKLKTNSIHEPYGCKRLLATRQQNKNVFFFFIYIKHFYVFRNTRITVYSLIYEGAEYCYSIFFDFILSFLFFSLSSHFSVSLCK